jgi:LysR family transcriptional regulator, transcriptional activator for bauABCD operon
LNSIVRAFTLEKIKVIRDDQSMKQVMDLDLRLLRVFLAVADAGSFSGAQPQLNVGGSTISLHMRELEKRVGFRLCERGRGGFELTERGRLFYESTRRTLGALDDFAGSIATLRNTLGGSLLLGMVDCLTTHPDFPLARALRRFNAINHEVHIELTVAPSGELERAIHGGRLHAAIVPQKTRSREFRTRPLLRERHHLYCGRGHPLYNRADDAVGNQEVTSHWFVLRSYNQAFDLTRFPRQSHRATVDSMEGMAVLLISGGYLGYLPEHYAQSMVERGQLKRVPAQGFSYTSNHILITARGDRVPPALETFLRMISSASDGKCE